MMKCPICRNNIFDDVEAGYDGCVTDLNRYGRERDCTHNAKKCKSCGCAFTIWEKEEVRPR